MKQRPPSAAADTILYPIEILCFLLNLLFAVCCFANVGRLPTKILGIGLDRELLMGFVFLLLTPLILLLIHLLNPRTGMFARLIRLCYLQGLYALYFTESILLSQLWFGGASLDAFFAGLDQKLFGFQPSLELFRLLQAYPLINEVFFFSYFFFYALVTMGVWVLFFRRRFHEAEQVLFIISASFFVMYAWFIFFPVQGPKYYFAELHAVWYANFRGYFFTGLMKGLFNHTNLAGAAFPSSHVAVALVALLLNFRHNRILALLCLPLTLLLIVSTIYLYAHFVIDIAAGLVVGLALYYLVPRLQPGARRVADWVGSALATRLGFSPMAATTGASSGRRLSDHASGDDLQAGDARVVVVDQWKSRP